MQILYERIKMYPVEILRIIHEKREISSLTDHKGKLFLDEETPVLKLRRFDFIIFNSELEGN